MPLYMNVLESDFVGMGWDGMKYTICKFSLFPFKITIRWADVWSLLEWEYDEIKLFYIFNGFVDLNYSSNFDFFHEIQSFSPVFL